MNLKSFIERISQKDRVWWQAGTALIICTLLLGGIALFAPKAKEAPKAEEVVVTPKPDAYQDIRLQGSAAIVYDLKTGQTLYERNAEAQLPLASLTKLLTLYAAADSLSDTTQVPLTATALSAEGESGFIEGESFMFKDLARLALVASSNDAAAAIAEAAQKKVGVAGSALLASAAQAAHLSQTYALNGTGLDEDTKISGGYGSAKDVALLAGALLERAPDLARASTLSSVTVTSNNGIVYTMKNTNQGVVRVPGVLLSKTGFTDLAGGNLVVVYDTGMGHPIAVVILGSTIDGRFVDVARLIDATHAHFAGTTP